MNSDQLSPRQLRLVLVAMCLALGTVVSAVSSLNVALPGLANDLGASQTQLQWIVDAYAVVFAGLLLAAGAVGDRLGRKPVLMAGLVVFAVAAAAAPAVDDADGLIAVRAVMGVGAAMIMPATLSIISSTFPEESRGRAVSIWAGVAGGSALLGLLASGLLLEVFTWHSVFVFSACLALFALLVAARATPNSKLDRARLDAIGGALSALALSGLVFGIIEGPERGWGDPVTLGAFAVAVLLGLGFIGWELRRKEPLLDPRLFALPGFSAGTASITAQFFAFFGFIFVVLQYVQFVLGYSPLQAGLALAPMAVLMMGLSPRVPRLLGRFGPGRVGAAGLLSMAAGFLVFSTAAADSGYLLLLWGLVLLGIGGALATTPATTAIVDSLPPEKQGVASAVNDAAREVGGALGIAVLGSALADRYEAGVPDQVPGAPAAVVHAANDALPAAMAIAEKLGPRGELLASRAQEAFVDGFGLAMLVAAGAVALTAVFVAYRAPSRVAARPPAPQRRPLPPRATAAAAAPRSRSRP